MTDAALAEQVSRLKEFSAKMTQKLKDPSQQIQLQSSKLCEQFGVFFASASGILRTKFAYYLQKEIRTFLKVFVLPRISKLLKHKPESFTFIQEICDIWQNYERFVFALKFYANAADNTFRSFHKFAAKFQSALANQQNADKTDMNYRNQVSPVPVMAVNQLSQFLKNEGLLLPLINSFAQIFCNFLRDQREGMNTPRDKINQALQFLEAIHLDYDCDCVRKGQSIKIVKVLNIINPAGRKSTADYFFQKNFTQNIFSDGEKYYRNWVNSKGLNMPATDEIKEMIKFLEKEQGRAKFYIHDNKNQKKYLEIVEKSLIEYKLEERLMKTSGFKYFLANYEFDKPEMMEEINNFWKVYKRVYSGDNNAKSIILGIYDSYFKQEAVNISQFLQKPSQFIEQSIKLNKKNSQIITKLLGNILDFDRIRVQCMQNLLAMKFSQKEKVKDYTGSKHWASYLNAKLKNKYGKTQKYGESEADLLNLFKLLIHKLIAINEHCKLLNLRLLDDIDMSLQAQYSNALDLELKILEEIKKQSSENEIKSIQGCLKDVQTSLDLRSKLKASKKMAPYGFFNQIIRKSGNYWIDSSMYDIQPPAILRNCISTIRSELQNENLVFQLHNGTSLFTATIKNEMHKFSLKNIYLMILLLIDEKPNKKMFFTDITKEIRPIGLTSPKSLLELIKSLIELTLFGLLKCNKAFNQPGADIQNWSASDYFEINLGFSPPGAKKPAVYRTINLTAIPDFLRKAFSEKLQTLDSEQKKIEKDRRFIVEGTCVRMLKHSQTLDGGKGTITFDELLKGQKRQSNVDSKYLKQVLEHLINNGLCERVEDKKNTFRYKS